SKQFAVTLSAWDKRLNSFIPSSCDDAILVHLHPALYSADTSTRSNLAFSPSAASSQIRSFHELGFGARLDQPPDGQRSECPGACRICTRSRACAFAAFAEKVP